MKTKTLKLVAGILTAAVCLGWTLPARAFRTDGGQGGNAAEQLGFAPVTAGAAGAAPAKLTANQADLQEPRAFASLPGKGDFSAIPDHSFSYLNELTVKLVDASVSSIDIAMYSFTMQEISDALSRAKARGVKVRVIMDESHIYPKTSPQLQALIAAGGIDIRTLRGTRSYGVNHNKIGMFDNAIVTSGSYNWTFSATTCNYENMITFRAPVYVTAFAGYFDWMWERSRPLEQGPSPELPEGHYGVPPQDPSPAMALNGEPVPAYLFSPGSNTETRLARIIAAAKNTLDVVTFTFSSKPLADAVVAAKNRGVKVRMLMDQTMAKDSAMAKYVFSSGVDFRVRGGRVDKGALHNKFAILDGGLLETGSFNWTTNASLHSFENVIFTDEAVAIKDYQAEYDWRYSNSSAPGADFFTQEVSSAAAAANTAGPDPIN